MGRMIVSNSRESFDRVYEQHVLSGFRDSGKAQYSGIEVGLLSKNKETICLIETESGFVTILGSCLPIDGPLDLNIGQYIYNIFDGDVPELRSKIFGNYCIAIKKFGGMHIFTDDYNTIKIYYYFKDDLFCLTNTFLALTAVSQQISVDKIGLLELAFQHSVLGCDTPFTQIKQLLGNEYFLLNENGISLRKCPKVERKIAHNRSNEELAFLLSQKLKKYFRIITEKFSSIGINMTGGLDSRIILAGFLSSGAQPTLLFGVGNSPLTNTKEEDLKINNLIADKYNLELKIMNWDSENPSDDKLEELLVKYHEYFNLYGGNENILEEYSNKIPKGCDFIEFGYFGEMIRNLPWIELTKNDPIPINKIVGNYFFADPAIFSSHGSALKSKLKNKIGEIFFQLGGTTEFIGKDLFQQFHAQYRYSADTVMNNFSNSFCSSVIMMGIPEIHEFILQIPYRAKQDGSFQLKLIENLYPDLLGVKFFSHAEEWLFDSEHFKLVPSKGQLIEESRFRKILKKNHFLKEIYSHFKIRFFKMNAKDRNEFIESINMKKLYVKKIDQIQKELKLELINPKKYYGDVRFLVKYYQLLYMIKYIEISKKVSSSNKIKVGPLH